MCERFRSVNRTVPDVAKHRQGPTQTLLFTLTFAVSVRYGGAPGDLQSVNDIALVNFERMSLEDNLVTHHKDQSRHKAYPRPWQRSNRSTWPRLRESLLNVPVGALFPYRRGFRADLIWFDLLMPNNLLCLFLKDLFFKRCTASTKASWIRPTAKARALFASRVFCLLKQIHFHQYNLPFIVKGWTQTCTRYKGNL